MDTQKELEYLREKVVLLEKCLEYERLLREMREAAPRKVEYVPYIPWVSQPSATGEPYGYPDTHTIC